VLVRAEDAVAEVPIWPRFLVHIPILDVPTAFSELDPLDGSEHVEEVRAGHHRLAIPHDFEVRVDVAVRQDRLQAIAEPPDCVEDHARSKK
jgi:hypothetical protein